MSRLVISLFMFAVAASLECRGQGIPHDGDTTKYWRVETNDENEFVGKIKSMENGIMSLMTEKFGVINIRMADIKSIEEADPKKIIGDSYWSENFQSTRYFWMPNGYGLKPGEAYYQNVWILFNQFSVGVTKNFSIGGGIMPLFLFGAKSAPMWINPKLSLPVSKKVSFGVGVLYGGLVGFSDDIDSEGGGIAYGVVTLGSRDKNASFGVGYGFSGDRFARRPVITFASMTRLGQRSYFMTENYLIMTGDDTNEAVGLISFGGRRLIKKVGLDFGGFIPVGGGMDRLIVIPWLGITTPLGKRYPTD